MRFLLFLSIVSAVLGTTTTNTVTEEKPTSTPSPGTDHRAIIALTLHPEDPDLLERTLYDVSTPGSPRYGKYLTREEALSLTKPSNASFETVAQWLDMNGVPTGEMTTGYDWIRVPMKYSAAQNLFDTDMSFSMLPGDVIIPSIDSYTVPEKLVSHIAMIQCIHPLKPETNDHILPEEHFVSQMLGPDSSSWKEKYGDDATTRPDNKSQLMIPHRVKELYGVNSTDEPAPGLFIGVAGFMGQKPGLRSLWTYMLSYVRPLRLKTFSAAIINGGDMRGDDEGIIANLDVQLVAGLAPHIPIRFYSVGGNGPKVPDLDAPDTIYGLYDDVIEPWFEFAQHLLSLPDEELPRVVTIAYGENEQLIPKPYAQKVCRMFGQLGTRGVSVITASGKTCPWVTAVAATTKTHPEEAADEDVDGFMFTSSGGFSDYFPRPKYQDREVEKWLKGNGDRGRDYFNPEGRAVPDVSAQGGKNLPYIHNLENREDGVGTNAAAPIFAAIIALLNNERALDGKPYLGFLNPWLYGEGSKGLVDIRLGRNRGCVGKSYTGDPAPIIPEAGFEATSGWDPVTGLGTPFYETLKQVQP
ncbi:hypothetical protein CkaCkLH20_01643 [Colletotrichum karsti]|uniref:Peptidase S53 domain-containing protein n=1 Tax=Colletotrichum karsti TaxID=1095194 RepID=A0A9P6IEV0_9PEZI|nr:uncharacterized protein CkaCkLH20_01643 [Colletotrichum karsti]KAF9880601.1 hypothetical protein CkaCkLH20_01643 [Colletotrichum karsti]